MGERLLPDALELRTNDGTSKGSSSSKTTCTTQGGINIKHQPVVDLNKLLKEQGALSKTIEQVKHNQQSWRQDPQPEVTNASPMALVPPESSNEVKMSAEFHADATKCLKINVHSSRIF